MKPAMGSHLVVLAKALLLCWDKVGTTGPERNLSLTALPERGENIIISMLQSHTPFHTKYRFLKKT